MTGEFWLAPDGGPLPLTADQILAALRGFIWKAAAGSGALRITEIDRYARGAREMRWSDAAGPGYDRFVVETSGEMEADGYRIPVHLDAGWRLGDPNEFRFFRARMERDSSSGSSLP